jgi:hypothetical protein
MHSHLLCVDHPTASSLYRHNFWVSSSEALQVGASRGGVLFEQERDSNRHIKTIISSHFSAFLLHVFFSRGVLRYFTQTWRNKSFRCLLRRLPRPQDVSHLRLHYWNFFNPFYNLNCSAWERAPWRRVTEKSPFSTLNVGLAGTYGNRTQATCLAVSVTRRSAIHYASLFKLICCVVFLISFLWIVREYHKGRSCVIVCHGLVEFEGARAVWDGIHQIVSRFLEQFCYLCPLLFSCVFPS